MTIFGLLLLATSAGQDVRFPDDAGVVDVTKPPYGARGDGRTDDTAAIQQALADHPNQGAIIYLPEGTYLISATLKWPHGSRGGLEEKNTILQGQGREKSVLKLKDGAAPDPSKPLAMIWTGQKPAQRFRNAVRDLTFDTGRDNPGAIGAHFMANNQGCFRDVTIRSGDGKGRIGLDLGYSDENGPLLVKNVRVLGFEVGVKTAFAVDSIVIEHLALEGQSRAGLENQGQCVSLRGLKSRNAVPAVVNGRGPGFLVLIDSVLEGTAGGPAIVNEAALFQRNVEIRGYDGAETVKERVSHPVHSLFDVPASSLNLPIRETPDVPWDEPGDWTGPTKFGGAAGDKDDDTKAIQAAIDSGKTTVYLPRGTWIVDDTIVLRGKVRRLLGCEASVALGPNLQGRDKPVFRVEDGESDVVVIERLRGGYERGPHVRFEHASKRALVIRDVTCGQGRSFRSTPGAGPVFIEDVVGAEWSFGRQEVWARQLNAENAGTKVLNDGGSVWILGFKTEREGTLLATRNGGRSEVLGGFAYATSGPKTEPMFINDDSSMSVSLGESCFGKHPFEILVRETRGGVVRELRKGQTPGRTGGSLIPLYVGRPVR